MTPEQDQNIRTFAAALRSGEYKQIVNHYREVDNPDGTKNCCALGVAWDLYGPGEGDADRWFPDPQGINNNIIITKRPHDEFTHTFIDEYRSPAELTNHKLGIPGWKLLEMNDQEKLTFSQIADLIERDYLDQ